MHGGIFGSKRRTVRRLAACKVPHRAMYPKVHSNGFEKKNYKTQYGDEKGRRIVSGGNGPAHNKSEMTM